MMDDSQFNRLLQHFTLSWKGYRKVRKGVKKRLRRHMLSLGSADIDSYIDAIGGSPEDEAECRRLLTVPITRFFRDRRLWEALEYDLLPEMTAGYKGKFRVWSAGCSGGEEAYSVAIIWQRISEIKEIMPGLEILGTDINPECLERARRRVYPASSLKEVSDEVRQAFFIKRKKQYEVYAGSGKMIRWEQRNIFDNPPGKMFDIIFLRNNLLTYYQNPLKNAGFKKVVSSLKPLGLLVTGAHENLPETGDGLVRSDKNPLIYTKHQ